jgi:hypothetical protein
MRKTNPIWAGQGPGPEVKCAKRTQFRPSARKWARAGGSRRPAGLRLCKTKPISPARARAGGKSCKTNPIPGGTGPQGRGTQGKCAERTQLGGLGLSLAAWRRGLAVGPEGHQKNALRRHYQRPETPYDVTTSARKRLTASLQTPAPPGGADGTCLWTPEWSLQEVRVS